MATKEYSEPRKRVTVAARSSGEALRKFGNLVSNPSDWQAVTMDPMPDGLDRYSFEPTDECVEQCAKARRLIEAGRLSEVDTRWFVVTTGTAAALVNAINFGFAWLLLS